MSIEDIREKIKGMRAWGASVQGLQGFRSTQMRPLSDDLFLGLILILVAFGSFGLGRLSKIEGAKTPIRIENAPEVTAETFSASASENQSPDNSAQMASATGAMNGGLLGSKNGTKYYYAWCAGAQRITAANRIYFASKDDAEVQGYTPASNCKGR